MTANRDLAAQARAHAAAAPAGSLNRRAWGCTAVVLATTSTIPAAQKALAAWDGPPEVATAALARLGELEHGPPGARPDRPPGGSPDAAHRGGAATNRS